MTSYVQWHETNHSASNHTKAKHPFLILLQVFRQIEPVQRVDCLAQMKNKRQVFLQRTQQNLDNCLVWS